MAQITTILLHTEGLVSFVSLSTVVLKNLDEKLSLIKCMLVHTTNISYFLLLPARLGEKSFSSKFDKNEIFEKKLPGSVVEFYNEAGEIQ